MAAQEDIYFDVFQSFSHAAQSPKFIRDGGCGNPAYRLGDALTDIIYNVMTCNAQCVETSECTQFALGYNSNAGWVLLQV